MQREPGWPKGIIRTEHGYSFISAGLIDDWAHYRKGDYIGSVDQRATVKQVDALIHGEPDAEPRTPKGDWVEARKQAVKEGRV